MADEPLGKLYVSVEARTAALEKALARTEAQTKKWKASVEQFLRGPQREFQRTSDIAARSLKKIEAQSATSAAAILSNFKSVGTGLAGAFGAQQFVKFADANTRIMNSLKVAGIEGKALGDVYQRLGRIALDNGASFESVASLYAKVTQAQKTLGVSSRETLEFTRRIAVGLKASGTDAQAASAGIMQLNQALQSGVLRGDEFNSVAENLPVVAQAIAKGMGVTVGKLRELAAEGALDARTVFQAFMKGSTDLDAQAAKTAMTFGQAMENITTALTMAVGSFNDSTGAAQAFADVVNNALVPSITTLGEVMGYNNSKIQEFSDWLGRVTGLRALGDQMRQVGAELAATTDPLLAAFDAAQAKIRAARGALKQDFDLIADDFSEAMGELRDASQEDVASGLSVAFVGLQAKIADNSVEARDFDSIIAGLVATGNTAADHIAGRLELMQAKFAETGKAAEKAFQDAGAALAQALGEGALAVVDNLAARLGDKLPESVSRFTDALKDALVVLGKLDSASAQVLTQISGAGYQPGDLNTGPGGGFLNFATGNETPTNSPDYIPLPDSVDVTPERRIDPYFGDAERAGARAGARAGKGFQTALRRFLARGRDTSHVDNLDNDFAERLSAFLAAAPGGGITINSGYRSFQRQAELWQAALIKYGSPEAARKWVAPPGRSNHNRGGAADLGFSSSAVATWAHANAADYGLNFRLGNEPWHIESAGGSRGITDAWAGMRGATDEATAAIDAQAEAYKQLADIGVGALKSIASAMSDGKITSEEWLQILADIATQLLQMPAIPGASGFLGGGIGGGTASGGGNILGSLLGGLGSLFGFADGGEVATQIRTPGPVRGIGGPRGDKILARLSDGEFVVNANATRKHRPLLRALNAGRDIPGLADGGDVGWFMNRPMDTPTAKAGRLAFQRHDYDRPAQDTLDVAVGVKVSDKGELQGYVDSVSRRNALGVVSRYSYAQRQGGAASDDHRYRRLKRDT
ncbi:tape measure protein [Mesorhizobium sp. IMUNJ 23232]|uniref:tape measure protein n=1 Tax=Mesorhizobium sp. IMUNJ 23232 TaxID=3376064 RepID=UPI0037B3473F